MRTRAELARVIARNPLAGVARTLALPRHVSPREAGGEARARAARPGCRARADCRERARGLLVAPGGLQSSPLAKLLSKTGVSAAGTNRNWRTVTKLLELADEGTA